MNTSSQPVAFALCQRLRSAMLGLALLAAPGSAAIAQSFTYQGQLSATGSPATGHYDFELRLFPALIGGMQVGATSPRTNIEVVNGVFTVEIDPGPATFPGGTPDRWLEISVKPSGPGSFTTLTPRQKIAPAPYAIRALNEWFSPVSTDRLTNDPARTKLFLNRSFPLTGNEYFGITTPTGVNIFGGMYINTSDAQGKPFYGYATGGIVRAFTYFNSADESWRLTTDGVDRLVVSDLGFLGIGTSSPGAKLEVAGEVRADNFEYAAPKVRYLSIPPCAFTPRLQGEGAVVESPVGGAYYDASVGAANMSAPVQLPHRARITSVTIWLIDNSASEMTASIYRRAYAATLYFGTSIGATSGASSTAQLLTNDSVNLLIDNTLNTYTLGVFCADWEGTATQIKGALITYTVNEAD